MAVASTKLRDFLLAAGAPVSFFWEYAWGDYEFAHHWAKLEQTQRNKITYSAICAEAISIQISSGFAGGFRKYDLQDVGEAEQGGNMIKMLFKHCRSEQHLVVRLSSKASFVGQLRLSHDESNGYVQVQIATMAGKVMFQAVTQDTMPLTARPIIWGLKASMVQKGILSRLQEVSLVLAGSEGVPCTPEMDLWWRPRKKTRGKGPVPFVLAKCEPVEDVGMPFGDQLDYYGSSDSESGL